MRWLVLVVCIRSLSRVWGQFHCHTMSCNQTATEIAESLNSTIEPCDDFYRFACDGWIGTHPVSDVVNAISQFDLLEHQVVAKTKTMLDANENRSNGNWWRMLQYLYQSCLNGKRLQEWKT